jgi:hypothetical protein
VKLVTRRLPDARIRIELLAETPAETADLTSFVMALNAGASVGSVSLSIKSLHFQTSTGGRAGRGIDEIAIETASAVADVLETGAAR